MSLNPKLELIVNSTAAQATRMSLGKIDVIP